MKHSKKSKFDLLVQALEETRDLSDSSNEDENEVTIEDFIETEQEKEIESRETSEKIVIENDEANSDNSRLSMEVSVEDDQETELQQTSETVTEYETLRFFQTLGEAEKAIQDHEIRTSTKYSVHAKEAGFAKEEFDLTKHKILYEDIKQKDTYRQHIEFTGVPFIMVGKKRYDCSHGVDRGISTKKKYLEEKLKKVKEDHCFIKSRFHAQNTKKVNCPATIVLRDIVMFPTFKATANTAGRKRTTSEKLKAQWLKDRNNVPVERKIAASFPDMSSHSGHFVNSLGGMSQQIDKRIIARIKEHVHEGVRDISEMRRCVARFVKEDIFHRDMLPEITNRRFFPTPRDVRNHMYNASQELKHSKIDQENLAKIIESWKKERPNDTFFFRGYKNQDAQTTDRERLWFNEHGIRIDGDYDEKKTEKRNCMLFLHQTKEQRRLLLRFGNSLSSLDATYKTTKYAVPLFFVVVKTNVDYQVVATFATQDETYITILEGLTIIKSLCPEWNPGVFMMDNCEAEIKAVSQLFPECMVLLCDFHREQAWLRWLSASHNGMREQKDNALALIRAVACAETQQQYEESIKCLKESDLWKADKSKAFREWITSTWLPVHKMWVRAFRGDLMEISVNTNNGVERKNRDLKHGYLLKYKDKTLSGMATVLIEQFLPDSYKSYIEKNMRSCNLYRSYNNVLPVWLHNRPKSYVSHCVEKIEMASSITPDDIRQVDDITYTVKSEQMDKNHTVYFGDNSSFPYCTCHNWKKHRLPCKHMMAIFRHHDVSWETFGSCYRESVFFNLDYGVLGILGDQEKVHIDTADDQPNTLPEVAPDNTGDDDTYNELPLPSAAKKRLQSAVFRGHLAELKSLSYLVEDETIFNESIPQLEDMIMSLKKKTKVDHGLIVEQNSKKRKLSQTPIIKKSAYKPLPETKKKKTKRYGAAEEAKIASKTISVENENIDVPVVVEEIVGLTKPAVYDVPMNDGAEIDTYKDCFVDLDAKAVVQKILKTDQDHVMAYVFNIYQVYSRHIRDTCCTKLTDDIINAYLDIINHENKAYVIECGVMTTIISGQALPFSKKRKETMMKSEIIIGVYNIGCHWYLLVIDPKKQEVILINPLGELRKDISRVKQRWGQFVEQNNLPKRWKIKTVVHPKQEDSISCGVFCLRFAECFMKKLPIPNTFNSREVVEYRERIAIDIIKEGGFGDWSKMYCRICGRDESPNKDQLDVDEWIQCDHCSPEKWFHLSCVVVDNDMSHSMGCCNIKPAGKNKKSRTTSATKSQQKKKKKI